MVADHGGSTPCSADQKAAGLADCVMVALKGAARKKKAVLF
jgi:hypothetical protein